MKIFPAPAHMDSTRGWNFNPRKRSYLWTDCHGTANLPQICGDWMAQYSGTSAGMNYAAAIGSSSPNGEGIALLQTGSTATGRGAIASSSFERLCLGTAEVSFETRLYLSGLSTAQEAFVAHAGLLDSLTGSAIDGAYFASPAAVSSGCWTVTTSASGVATTTDTGVVAVAGVYSVLRIEVDARASRVTFAINDRTVATHTTNIPNGFAQRTGAAINIRKTAGTSSRYIACDYAMLSWEVDR